MQIFTYFTNLLHSTPRLHSIKEFSSFFVFIFVKVIEIHLKMLMIVNFEKRQQDLSQTWDLMAF